MRFHQFFERHTLSECIRVSPCMWDNCRTCASSPNINVIHRHSTTFLERCTFKMVRRNYMSSIPVQHHSYLHYTVYDIYLLTAIGLSPGDSTHLHTNNTQNNTNNNRTTQITNNVEECRPCPVFASFTLAFAFQLRKKHGKTSVRLIKTSVSITISTRH